MRESQVKHFVQGQEHSTKIKKKLNYEQISQKALKQLKFIEKNEAYVKYMESLKFKPGGLTVFNPASAHHRYNSCLIKMNHYLHTMNGGKDKTKSILDQLSVNQSMQELELHRDNQGTTSGISLTRSNPGASVLKTEPSKAEFASVEDLKLVVKKKLKHLDNRP